MHSVLSSPIFLRMRLPCFIVAVLKYISATKRLNSLLSLVSLRLCPARFHSPYLSHLLPSFPPALSRVSFPILLPPICHCHSLLPFAITYIPRSFLPSAPLSLRINTPPPLPPSPLLPLGLAPAHLPCFPLSVTGILYGLPLLPSFSATPPHLFHPPFLPPPPISLHSFSTKLSPFPSLPLPPTFSVMVSVRRILFRFPC